MPKKENMRSTKLIVPCRISFANIWKPRNINGEGEKYSVSCLIPKSDKATLEEICYAINAAAEEGMVFRWGGRSLSSLKTPMHDGDLDRPDDEAYAGMMYFNANSKEAPQIVDRKRAFITTPMAVYSGCYCNVSVNFYPFSVNGRRGIAAGLCNIQLVKAGKRLYGHSSAMDDFYDLGDDEDMLGDAMPF